MHLSPCYDATTKTPVKPVLGDGVDVLLVNFLRDHVRHASRRRQQLPAPVGEVTLQSTPADLGIREHEWMGITHAMQVMFGASNYELSFSMTLKQLQDRLPAQRRLYAA